MRILQLTSTLPLSPAGSSAPFILHIGRALAARGHDVHLLAPYHPDVRWGERSEGKLHLHFFRYAPLRSWHIWGYGQSLQSDVKLKPGVLLLLPLAASSAIRHLRRLQNRFGPFDLLHAHWLLPNGVLAALARRRGQPMVISLHGSDLYMARKTAMFRRAARYSLERAAAVVGCSEELTGRAREIFPHPTMYHTLPYGVDESVFQPDEAPPDAVSILAAGRLVEKKGFEYLIKALGRMKTAAHLHLAGDGDLRRQLEATAAAAGVGDRVSFVGDVSQPELVTLYRRCALFVLPSIVDSGGNVDGLPNVLLEAMSAGMAVVASRVGGVPAVIRHGQNGLLVEPKDVNGLAAVLDRLLSNPPLRAGLGTAARRTILEGYTWQHYAIEFERILREVGNR